MQNQNLIPTYSGKNLPLALLRGDQRSLDAFTAALPTSIEQAVHFPSVGEIVAQIGSKEPVLRWLESELVRVNDILCLGQKLTDETIQFIASQFVEKFSRNSLADFKICLTMGCIGDFDYENPKPLYSFDSIVFRRWFEKYKEKKYDVAARELYKDKDKIYQPLATDPHPNIRVVKHVTKEEEREYFKQMLDAIRNTPVARRVPLLSRSEINKTGQVRPPDPEPYPSTDWDYIISKELHIAWVRENHDMYGKPVPGYVDENSWLKNLSDQRYKEILKSIKRTVL